MAIFELTGGTSTLPMPTMLGIWQPIPAPPSPSAGGNTASVSFGTLGTPDTVSRTDDSHNTALPTWRVRLPNNVEQAYALLATGEQQVATAYANLPLAHQRMETIAMLAEAREETATTDHTVAFASSSFALPTLAPDEQVILDLLRQGATTTGTTDAPGTNPSPSAVSFGGLDAAVGAGDYRQQATAFIAQLQQAISAYMFVETTIDDRLLARTAVGWTGDYTTTWSTTPPPTRDHMQVHLRTVQLATSSRDALVLIVQETIRLLFLVSTPAGALLAIPAAWQLINRILQYGG